MIKRQINGNRRERTTRFSILSFTYGPSLVEADCKHKPHLEWSLSKALSWWLSKTHHESACR